MSDVMLGQGRPEEEWKKRAIYPAPPPQTATQHIVGGLKDMAKGFGNAVNYAAREQEIPMTRRAQEPRPPFVAPEVQNEQQIGEQTQQQPATAPAQTKQTATKTQPTTQPARQTDQQTATGPGLLPFQSQAATAPDNAQWNVANGGRDGQSPIETAIVGNKQYWRTEGGVASKELNQQPRAAAGQSRPGLGLNGMRDLGNGQVAVGQVDGFQNPGYGFKGSREDAARFFQPVGRPGGYNPYKQRFRTLFDEQMDARAAARATPQPAEQGLMGWKRLRDQMNNESRERIADQQTRLGYSTAASRDALQQQQLAQQYGLGMMQFMDNQQTNALNRQQTAQQMRQQQMLDSARYTLATADPNSEEYKRAERVAKTYGDGKERNFGFQTVDVDNGDGTTSKRIYVTDPSTGTVAPAQMAGGQGGDPYAFDERQIAQAFSSPAGIKALQDGTWEKYLQDIREKAKKLKS